MSFTAYWNVVSGEVATAAKTSQLGANDDYLLALIQAAISPGVMTAFAGSQVPNGFLLCNGQAVSRTTYADLFAVIGTTYGEGDSSTTFNVPDLRGKVVGGFDSAQSEFNGLGKNFGAKTHVLSVNEMPSHNHSISSNSHRHTGPFATPQIIKNIVNNADAPHGFSDGAVTRNSSVHTHSHNIGNRGGNAAHNNIQPTQAHNWIIKT